MQISMEIENSKWFLVYTKAREEKRAKKNLENITNKFYRVNENSWNNSLGLGLFIVSNILNLHHFILKIESQENEGSSFSVMF